MLDAGNTLANFLALHASNVRQHAFFAEVSLGQIVGGQRSSVVRRQRDQVVEDAGVARRITLEGLNATIRFFRQIGGVVIDAHQFGAIVLGYVLAVLAPGIEHLLTEIQASS